MRSLTLSALLCCLALSTVARAQTPAPHTPVLIPFNATPSLSPGILELLKLEGAFSDAVAKGGGPAFAAWFATDGVTLSNGKPAVQGLAAITASATWDPREFQLTWYAEGAQMGPDNDTGFTWGHYDATTIHDGHTTTVAGRYITFWKKVHGTWKVALDASADDAPTPSGAETPNSPLK